MRRNVVLSGLVVLTALFLGPLSPASAASSPFRGSWTSTDTDGSHQTMAVHGAGVTGHYSVFVTDDSATAACGGAPANVQGSGVAEGNTLSWTFTVTCPGTGRPPIIGRIGDSLAYDAEDDILTDGSGVVWYRAG